MMKKLLVLCFVLLIGVVPTRAQPTTLTALARYFPADTPAFAAVQTDDAMIDMLDGLIGDVLAKVPSDFALPSFSLRSTFDRLTMQASGGDFDTTIRPWLGNTIAVGLAPPENMLRGPFSVYAAISIRDRAATERFFSSLFPHYLTGAEGGFTLFAAPSPNLASFAVGDEVAFITNSLGGLPIHGVQGGTLAENATFLETLELLPEAHHSALGYVNTWEIVRPMLGNMADLAGTIGGQAIGITILDERSLVVDAVANVGDLSALENMGFSVQGGAPFDPGFMTHIPANASLVLHLTDMKALYDLIVHNANAVQPSQTDQAVGMANTLIQNALGLNLGSDIIDWMTGDYALFVSIDAEAIFDWTMEYLMTDPLVFDEETRQGFLDAGNLNEFRPQRYPPLEPLPLGFGLVVEAADAAKAQTLAAALGNALAGIPSLTISREQIAGVDVAVLRQPIPLGTQLTIPLEVAIGANDEVLVVATRAEAERIFGGDLGLDSSAGYTEARGYFLENPTAGLYVDTRTIGGGGVLLGATLLGSGYGNIFPGECIVRPLLRTPTPTPQGAQPTATATPIETTPTTDACAEAHRRIRQEQLDNITRTNAESRRLLPLAYEMTNAIFSTASISTASSEDGNAWLRLVVTLAE